MTYRYSRSGGGSFLNLLIPLLIVIAIVAAVWLINEVTSAKNNVTCKKQDTAAGVVRYELCLSGQPHPVYVPYSAWRSTRVGGYYDESTHTGYSSVDDDPHVSHGIGGEGGEGHGEGGFHGGGGE